MGMQNGEQGAMDGKFATASDLTGTEARTAHAMVNTWRREGRRMKRAGIAIAVAFGVGICALLGLNLWVAVAYPGHIHAIVGVGTLAAVVGVIGAVGGLVVGVLALLTLTQVDQLVAAAFDRRYTEHRERLTQDSVQWATGLRVWTQSMMDLADGRFDRDQEALEQALAVWPEVPNARTEMVRHLWDAQQAAAIYDLWALRRNQVAMAGAFGRTYRALVRVRWTDTFRWWTMARDSETRTA